MQNFSKNIRRLYLIKISKWFNLVMPIIVLFYQDNGLGMHDIFVLKAIYSVSIVGMEIPSGWMADVWGRRKTLILGSLLSSTGILMYCFSYGFWAFALAEIVLGFGHSFVSGADSAMLYDTLKAEKKSDEYVKQEGRITSAGNFAEAIAGIAGGFLAAITFRTPFYYQLAITAIAIPAAFTLTEPGIRSSGQVHSLRRLFFSIRTTLSTNRNLRISIFLSALTGTATLTFAWLVQPFFKAINLSVEIFGILWTLLNVTVGVSSIFAHSLESFFKQKKTVILIVLFISAGYFLSGITISYAGLAFLFLFYIVRGLATPVLKNYINQYTDSDVRATILSVRNFIIRICFAAIGPLLGWITDTVGLNTAYLLAGSIYLFAAIIVILPWLHNNKHI